MAVTVCARIKLCVVNIEFSGRPSIVTCVDNRNAIIDKTASNIGTMKWNTRCKNVLRFN
jgi:hypothetical protein